jgi:hypothetical protein
MLVLRMFGLKPKRHGLIIDEENGKPLSFAKVRVLMADSDTEIIKKITDEYGRYFCLVPKGEYYVKIESKNIENEGYDPVYISESFKVKNGIIQKKYKITKQDKDKAKLEADMNREGQSGEIEVPDLLDQYSNE